MCFSDSVNLQVDGQCESGQVQAQKLLVIIFEDLWPSSTTLAGFQDTSTKVCAFPEYTKDQFISNVETPVTHIELLAMWRLR